MEVLLLYFGHRRHSKRWQDRSLSDIEYLK
jgi:hypothetical protein